MANIGGFEITTPEEVQAAAQQQLEQLRQANPQAANSQQVISALFGSPQMRQAQQTTASLNDALRNVVKRSGESEEEFQIRQNVSVREKMASVNPQVALQANENILRLQSDALERRVLSTRADKGEFDLKNALQTAVDLKTPVIYKRTAAGDVIPVQKLSPESTPDEINAAIADHQAREPGVQFFPGSMEQFFDLEDIDMDSGSGGGLNKSSLFKLETGLDETAALFNNADIFLEQMIESPLALVAGGRQGTTSADFLNQIRRVGGDLVNSDSEATNDQNIFNRVFDEQGFFRKVQDLGIDSSIARGLVLRMAYTLARTLDPGGRLSDQDVEMAIQMIVGTGDPNTLITLLDAGFRDAAFKAEAAKERALSGLLNGDIGRSKYERFEQTRDSTLEKLEIFKEIVKNGGLARVHSSVFGKSGQERTAIQERSDDQASEARKILQQRLDALKQQR